MYFHLVICVNGAYLEVLVFSTCQSYQTYCHNFSYFSLMRVDTGFFVKFGSQNNTIGTSTFEVVIVPRVATTSPGILRRVIVFSSIYQESSGGTPKDAPLTRCSRIPRN